MCTKVQGTDNYSCALEIEDNNHPNDKRLHMNPEQNILKVTKSIDNWKWQGPTAGADFFVPHKRLQNKVRRMTGMFARMLNVTVAHHLQ
jgi:hypothetical protein